MYYNDLIMKRILPVFLLLIIFTPCIYAHPHVYIDLCIEFEISGGGITGFRENWTILRQFGENIGIEYDMDNDRKFNEAETKRIKSELFDNIRKYNYYTYIGINGESYFPGKIRDFNAARLGNTTVLSFFVPCSLPAEKAGRIYELTVHDISRYVSFGLMYIDDPITDSFNYNIEIIRDGDFYSHSCDFGNAVLIITIKQNQNRNAVFNMPEPFAADQLEKLTSENTSPSETTSNPFIAEGIRIKDDNPNPFISY